MDNKNNIDKPKKITKKELERLRKLELKKKWLETRQVVIQRDKGCVICGSTERMNVHHIIPREVEEYFFDINNLIVLCIKHHKFGSPKSDISAHKNSFPFYLWLQENRPEQYEYVKKISKELFLNKIEKGKIKDPVGFRW